MSDGLTSPDRLESTEGRRTSRVVVLQVVAIVVVFAVVGALLGLLWYHLWDTPTGVVSSGQWFTDEAGLRDTFQGTGWYVVLAVAAGLVLGLVSAWVADRSELATLAAVVVGSVLAGLLMYLVGTHLSPGDPHVLAKTAKDGAKLDGQLTVDGWSPRAAFPFGALLGLVLVYFLTSRRTPAEPVARPVDGPEQTSSTAGSEAGFGAGTEG